MFLCVVSTGRHAPAAAGPVRVEELSARPINTLIRVRAEVITLSLQQVGGKACRAVAVVKGKRGRERGRGNAVLDGADDGATPPFLIIIQQAAEEVVQKQIFEITVLIEGFLDFSEEPAANDTATAPHQRDAAKVQVPALLPGGLAQEHEAL